MIFAVAVFPSYSEEFAFLLEQYDMPLPSLTNFSLPVMEVEWRQLTNNFIDGARTWTQTRDFKVGLELKEAGFEATHPGEPAPLCSV